MERRDALEPMNLRLLIVDDDTSLSGNLRSFFSGKDYKVEVANDGPSAVKTAEEFHPHLMFLDIGLPGMSGIEVLRQVKERDASIRVIMVTGQTEEELMRQARILGADDYVTKPFTLEYLNGEVMSKLHKQLFYELRAASADLALEREKVDLIFERVQQGVILFDSQGMVFTVNPYARKMLGLPTNTSMMSAEQVFKDFQVNPANVFKNLDTQDGQPFEVLRENPKKLVLECRINPIHSRQKERYGFVMIFRDITQERKAENAMHRFISLISHKLRTPLVAIRAYPRLLLSDTVKNPLNDFQKNALHVISQECHRMEEMVNQLIAFSSLDPETLSKQPCTAEELLQGSGKILPDEIKSKMADVKMDLSLKDAHIDGDPMLLQHVFRNLVENAFKFGAKQIKVKAQTENGSVVVQFQDDGPGIPPEDHLRIFDRFYQVEKDFSGQVPGAGLGLAMVKQTVEAHGGKTWVESVPGRGSTFFVQLPKASKS